jgi:hypothetical protein
VQEGRIRDKVQGTRAPVRGTQSFVGVMVEVFKRPSLVGIEITWRWVFWVVVAGLVWWRPWVNPSSQWSFAKILAYEASGRSIGYAAPFRDIETVAGLWKVAFVVSMVWAVASTVGRCAILPRLDNRLRVRWVTTAVLSMLRVLTLWLVWWLWGWILVETTQRMVYARMARGDEPSYVLGFAIVVGTTLVLFVGWCTVSWGLQLAPVMAMGRDEGVRESLRDARRSGELRGKLIEINLVMGIVKVALLVLAMVFSASPLPFSSVETQTFLTCWWCGVGVVWLVVSDYFHVVRMVAYLRLWRVYDSSAAGGAPGVEAAS